MEIKRFTECLEDKGIPFTKDGNWIVVDGDNDVDLAECTSLPENINFNNNGNVTISSCSKIPRNIKFNNNGYINLYKCIHLQKDVIFNNNGNVYLSFCVIAPEYRQFNNKKYVDISSLSTPYQIHKDKKFEVLHVRSNMLITSEIPHYEYTVYEAKFFYPFDNFKLLPWFLAYDNGVWSQGSTIKTAIENLQIKLLDKHNKQKVVKNG